MSFGRRTWNKEAYTELAKQPNHTENPLSSLSTDELQELKIKYTNYKELLESQLTDLNKRTLTANISEYKRGKTFGFYCELCDLTFKDSLQYVNHLNHKTHEIRFENIFDEPLILDKRDNDTIQATEVRQTYNECIRVFIEENRSTTTRSRKIKKRKINEKVINVTNLNQDCEIQKTMGFASFNSSKNK